MLSFDWPWLFILLPAPLLAYWLLPPASQPQAAVRVPFFSALGPEQALAAPHSSPAWHRVVLLFLAWLALLSAAAQPKWIGEAIELPSSGRDLLLAVDLSESMQIEDMQLQGETVNRLIAVKAVLKDFIARREGDRLGLVLFGSQAYLQAPLSFDRDTISQFLLEAQIGFAGPKTAIGDAIGLSIKRLRDRPGQRHVVILLTDGANTAGEVDPLTAARLASDEHVVIYTVGVGADEMTMPGLFGSRFGARTVNPSVDLDEKTLAKIAELTGGRYFRARNPQQLMDIYQLLDELEPVAGDKESFRPETALFYWPLAIALLISLLLGAAPLMPKIQIGSTGRTHHG